MWDTSKTYFYGRYDGTTGTTVAYQTSDTGIQSSWATWWRYDSDTKTWAHDGSQLTDSAEDLVFTFDATNSATAGYMFTYYPQKMSVNSIFIQDNALAELRSSYSKGCVFTVTGDFTKVGSGNLTIYTRGYTEAAHGYQDGAISISGNATFGNGKETAAVSVYFGRNGDITRGAYFGPLTYVNIGGDLVINSSQYTLRCNTGLQIWNVGDPIVCNVDNPMFTVGGLVKGTGVVHISDRGAFFGHISVMSIDGVSGGTIFRNNSAQTTRGAYSFLVLNNAAGTTSTSIGIVYDDGNSFNVSDSTEAGQALGYNSKSKVGIVMNGEGTQIFNTTGRMKFSGGIKVNRGTLLLNAQATGAGGAYIDNDDGTRTYQCTHGDLEINSGTFVFIYATAGGEYAFDNMIWKSGTIRLNIYESSFDTLVFIGDFGVSDGTVDSVVFDFVGDIATPLFAEKRLITWNTYDSDNINKDSFVANDIIQGGKTYSAQFRVANDGLYVQYVPAVPEPAAVAALLAVFVGLAIVRRRK